MTVDIRTLYNIIKSRNKILLEKVVRCFLDETISQAMSYPENWYNKEPCYIDEWEGKGAYCELKRIVFAERILDELHEGMTKEEWEEMIELFMEFYSYYLTRNERKVM